MAALHADGDIAFRQTWPLGAGGGYKAPYEHDPLLPVALQSATRQTLVSSDPAHPAAAAFLSLAGASADWGLPEFSRPAAVSAAVH